MNLFHREVLLCGIKRRLLLKYLQTTTTKTAFIVSNSLKIKNFKLMLTKIAYS